jgi:hypothetical protein
MLKKMLFVLITLSAVPAMADALLEPCIDGGISASGNYPSQQIEDLVLAATAQPSPPLGRLDAPARKDVAVPDDDKETCWVAPEWRVQPS